MITSYSLLAPVSFLQDIYFRRGKLGPPMHIGTDIQIFVIMPYFNFDFEE